MNEQQAMDVQSVERPISPIMRWFDYSHLPEPQAEVSNLFADLAMTIEETLPVGPEKSTALRKLLEAKDAAVRSSLEA
jgi:hypothetical protein